MSLRDELREPSGSALPYTWNTWIENMLPAADAHRGNHSDELILFSGLNYDLDETYFVQRQTWNDAISTPESYAYEGKIVYELHNYESSVTSCEDDIAPTLYDIAYCAMDLSNCSCPNHGPVVLTSLALTSDGTELAPALKSTVTSQPG